MYTVFKEKIEKIDYDSLNTQKVSPLVQCAAEPIIVTIRRRKKFTDGHFNNIIII